MSLTFHPLADIFPLMEGGEFDELVADIKANGLREPIVIYDDQVLDGRNRYRACQALGIEAPTETYSGVDPAAFVISLNIHRRHLNPSQRALLVADFARLSQGHVETQRIVNAEKSNDAGITAPAILTVDQAASLGRVNPSTVDEAKVVLARGNPEDIQAVREGRAAVSTIARRIRKEAKEGAPKKARKLSETGKNEQRIERQKFEASIWQTLSEALDGLASLPMATDVVAIVLSNPKRMQTLEGKLPRATSWLEGFADAWNRRSSDEAEAA